MNTAKIIFNWLRKAQLVCNNSDCKNCIYHNNTLMYNSCRVKNIILMLASKPKEWDIDSIEKEWDK